MAPHRPPKQRKLPLAVLALLAVVIAVGATYLWTATSSGNPLRFEDGASDPYNRLVDGFLAGHVHLETPPPAGLLALEDPYDPVANADFRVEGLHDLILYNERLYVYWGPTPALTLFLPFRVLGVGDMPMQFAVFLFSFGAFVVSSLLMLFMVRRFLPATPGWLQLIAIVGLGLGNVAPFVLRRPSVYEASIASGLCFHLAGLFLLATGAFGERIRPRRLALGSLCLGLAMGSRPQLGVAFIAIVLLAAWLMRSGRVAERSTRRLLVGLLGPFATCGVLLMLYNTLRFGSPGDFGIDHMLAAVDIRDRASLKLSFVLPGLWYYVIAPPRLTLAFPFVTLPPPPGFPGVLPAGYEAVEPTGGILPTLPIVLALFALPTLFRRRRAAIRPELMWSIGLLVLSAVAYLILIALLFPATTQRYEMDFVSLILIAALLSWFIWWASVRGRARHFVAVVGAALVAIGAALGTAVSITGYYDGLRAGQPGTFARLERTFSPLPTFATMVVGRPVIYDIRGGGGRQSEPINYGTFGAPTTSLWVGKGGATVRIVSPRRESYLLQAVIEPGPGATTLRRAPVVRAQSQAGSTVRVRVTGAQQAVPITLNRGLNDIEIDVVPGARRDPLSPTDPRVEQVVLLQEVRLAPASTP